MCLYLDMSDDVKQRAINQLYHLLVVMLRFIGPRVSGL